MKLRGEAVPRLAINRGDAFGFMLETELGGDAIARTTAHLGRALRLAHQRLECLHQRIDVAGRNQHTRLALANHRLGGTGARRHHRAYRPPWLRAG